MGGCDDGWRVMTPLTHTDWTGVVITVTIIVAFVALLILTRWFDAGS